MKFGERLKFLRTQEGITQKQLAEKTGTSERGIQNYEAGIRNPAYEALITLSDFFGVTIDYLVGKSDFLDYSASEDMIPFPMMCVRLRQLREAKGLNVVDVAKLIEDSPRNYAGYEEGEVLPRLRTICALADLFDVSLDYLIGRSDTTEMS